MSNFIDMTMPEFLERFPAFADRSFRLGTKLPMPIKGLMHDMEAYGYLRASYIPPDTGVRIYVRIYDVARVQERHAAELLRRSDGK